MLASTTTALVSATIILTATTVTFFKVIIADRLTASWLGIHTHLTNAVADVCTEAHITKNVQIFLAVSWRVGFATNFEFRGKEVFCSEAHTTFLVVEIFLQTQAVDPKSTL